MSNKINSHICFEVERLQKFSSNGQIWPARKLYAKRFNWKYTFL